MMSILPEMSDSDPITAIANLGPASALAFAKAGIHTASALRALGADAGYAQLLASGARPHFISYYVLVMGLQGRPWNDCKGAEKTALRQRFDTLCAAARQSGRGIDHQREAQLRYFGVIASL